MVATNRAQRSATTASRGARARATARRARDDEGDTARADDDRDRGARARGLEWTSNADETPRAPLGTALAGVNATSTAREDDHDDVLDASADRDVEARREIDEVDAPPAGRARNSQTGRFGPPIKAPPLFAEDIGRLGKDDRRRVLARWSGRLRGLKKRALELSAQFPTSNVCVYFTKPFPGETREGMWCVRTRVVVVGGGGVALVLERATDFPLFRAQGRRRASPGWTFSPTRVGDARRGKTERRPGHSPRARQRGGSQAVR